MPDLPPYHVALVALVKAAFIIDQQRDVALGRAAAALGWVETARDSLASGGRKADRTEELPRYAASLAGHLRNLDALNLAMNALFEVAETSGVTLAIGDTAFRRTVPFAPKP